MAKADHKQIGVYQVKKLLGGGGMGVVYLVEDQEGGGHYALKLLTAAISPTESESRRFRREFLTLSRLRHPNIIEVYESGVYKDSLYFVMEYVQGPTMSSRFLTSLPSPHDNPAYIEALNAPERLKAVLGNTQQICDALSWIHGQGIIHRDLKPDNIMLKSGNQAKLLDFGIAKRWGKNERTQVGSIMGTFTYISPEQAQCGDVDGRSDLYSLGVILYQLLSGQLPFDSEQPIGRLYMHLNATPPPPTQHNPHLSLLLEEIILRLLEKDPKDRFQRAEDLRDALQRSMDMLGLSEGESPSQSLMAPELRVKDAAYVGREAERATLLAHLDHVRDGKGGLVLVSGQRGVGKTRAVREFLTSARAQQIECCNARCLPESPPYSVYQELMEQLRVILNMRQDDLPQTLWGENGQYWFSMMKPDPTSPPSMDTFSSHSGGTEEEQMQLFESCRSMLEAILQHEPLILCLEDLMCADEISLALTEHLLRWNASFEGPYHLLIVGTFRNEEVETEHPLSRLLLQLAPQRLYQLHELQPLNDEEVSQMATSMLGLPPAQEALQQLMQQSQGIPYFVEELIKAWDEDNQLMEAGDCWYLLANAFSNEESSAVPGRLPATLQKRLVHRIARLSEQAKQVATWLSVLGQEATFDLLFALTSTQEATFLACLEELLQKKIITEDWSSGTERYRFAHPEFQEVLYKQIDEDNQPSFHLHIANTLKQSNAAEGCFEQLAHHFLRAHDVVQGAWYLLLAAEQQLRALAYHSSLELLEQCQELINKYHEESLFHTHSGWWQRMHQAQLELFEHTGRYREGIDLAQQALALMEDQGEQAPIKRWLAAFYRHVGEYKQALRCIKESLSEEHTGDALRPYLLQEAGHIYQAQGKHGKALEAFREALAWAMSKELAWEEGRLSRMIGSVLHQKGELEEARSHYARSYTIAQENKDPRGALAALCCKAKLSLDVGKTNNAYQYIQLAQEQAEEYGDRHTICLSSNLLGQLQLERRRFEEASEPFHRALQLAIDLGEQRMEGELLGWLGYLAMQQQRFHVARTHLEDALDKAMIIGNRLLELRQRCHLSLLDFYQQTRTPEELFEELQRILQITEKMGVVPLMLLCRLCTAQLHRLTRDTAAATDTLVAARHLAISIGHQRTLAHIERERFCMQEHKPQLIRHSQPATMPPKHT
jgi:predicted ATPase